MMSLRCLFLAGIGHSQMSGFVAKWSNGVAWPTSTISSYRQVLLIVGAPHARGSASEGIVVDILQCSTSGRIGYGLHCRHRNQVARIIPEALSEAVRSRVLLATCLRHDFLAKRQLYESVQSSGRNL